MKALTEKLKDSALHSGVQLFGVAPLERFDGSPPGHHPQDFLSSAQTVISIGAAIPRGVANYRHMLQGSPFIPAERREEYLQRYFYAAAGYDIINALLERVCLVLANTLEAEGFPSLYFPATYGAAYKSAQEMAREGEGMFSMRHAAVRAGLGEFGLNNVVVTPGFGPRMRFGAVITAASLEASPLLEKKACRGEECMLCIKKCVTGALTAGNPQLPGPVNPQGVWLDPVSRTHIPTCAGKRIKAFCHGLCIAVCPVGNLKLQ